MCVCAHAHAELGDGSGIGRGDRAQVGLVLGPLGGMPASGGRVGPHQSGSPQISQCGVQEWVGCGPVHPHHGALPLHSGPPGTHEWRLKAPGGREWAGWAGEKSCWQRHLGDAGEKGQEEKPEQRWFFSGEWESQEGRQPGKKRAGREMKKREEIIHSVSTRKVISPGSWSFPLWQQE